MSETVCSQCGGPLHDSTRGPLCDTCAAVPKADGDINAPADAAPPQVPTSRAATFRPWATYGLIGLNVLVYVLMIAAGISPINPNGEQLIRWGADFGPLTLTSQPWRLLSAAFLHIGLFHILLNMVSLLFLGSLAEAIYKRTTYLFIYVLSGVTGALASVLVNPLVPSAGASGAIFGIVGALIAAFKMGRLQLPPEVVKRELTTLFVFAGINLLQGAVRPNLDNAAHLGGLAAGSLMGIIIAVTVRRRGEYRRARNIAITMMIVIIVGGYISARELRMFTIVLEEGRLALSHGQFADARSRLEEAARMRPRNSLVQGYLGTTYTRLGDLPRAEEAFRRTVELNPRDMNARFQLAVVYFSQHKLTDAADTMRQLVQASPNDPRMHEFLAQILAEKGDMQEAQQEHDRAMELGQQGRSPRR